MKRYIELSEKELLIRTAPELRDEYRLLLEHHIEETSALISARRGPSIIVIGPDRVGKTTLVKHISDTLKIPAFKCPAEKRIFKEGGRSSLAFDYTLTHFMQQTGVRFVSDRGYPCEWVYSRVFGRETDDQLLELIDSAHEHIGTKILYVWSSEPPTEEDDLVPSEKYWDVVRMYDEFCRWTSAEVTQVDAATMLQAFRDGFDTSADVARAAIHMMGLSR